MDTSEPRARHRGFFLHSETTGEPDTGEHENPEGVVVRARLGRSSLPPPGCQRFGVGRPFAHLGRRRGFRSPNQIRERDWQPSTGTLAPLTQLARGEARKATTVPTSSGRPNRPNGSSRARKSAIPTGSSRCRLSHDPPGNRIEPGRHAVHADAVARQLLGKRLSEADFRGFHGVVGHAAARFASPDRRDHHDGTATPLTHVGHGQARGADRRKQGLVEGLLPFGVRRVERGCHLGQAPCC